MRNVQFFGAGILSWTRPCHLSRMAFTRIRTINGKEYLYEEHRWRGLDGKVKSRSIYLGPRTARRRSIFTPVEEPGLRYIERLIERDAAASRAVCVGTWEHRGARTTDERLTAESKQLTEERERLEAAKDKLSKELGVKFGSANPTPIEKTSAPAAAPHGSPQTGSAAPTTSSDDTQPSEATTPGADNGGPEGDRGSDTSA
jgi:hypothetical protein